MFIRSIEFFGLFGSFEEKVVFIFGCSFVAIGCLRFISLSQIGICDRCAWNKWLHLLESSNVETGISSVKLAS